MGTIRDKAQALLDGRLAATDVLENAQSRLDEIRTQVRDAEEAVSKAWEGALDAGWTETDLRSLGFSEPTTRRPGRPRTNRTGRSSSRRNSPARPTAPAAETPTQNVESHSTDTMH